MRYIFLISHHDEKSLKTIIRFCNNYSKSKSTIVETSTSKEEVNLLDVEVLVTGK